MVIDGLVFCFPTSLALPVITAIKELYYSKMPCRRSAKKGRDSLILHSNFCFIWTPSNEWDFLQGYTIETPKYVRNYGCNVRELTLICSCNLESVSEEWVRLRYGSMQWFAEFTCFHFCLLVPMLKSKPCWEIDNGKLREGEKKQGINLLQSCHMPWIISNGSLIFYLEDTLFFF